LMALLAFSMLQMAMRSDCSSSSSSQALHESSRR
jgi:hypothetical protein